ncbi:MAG TPA: response regulator transcription factor [Xanthobacteraceae bacterium]
MSVVCVIDDDLDVRESLSGLLRSVGLEVASFASTAEFQSKRAALAAACLIVDIRLPGLSGLDFQAELARQNLQLPIIFITGHGDIPMSVKAMKAGAVEFLTKPFREQDILDAVRVALDRDSERRRDEYRLSDLRSRLATLSPREREVVSLVTLGRMNKQVAAAIGISEITVKVHRHNAMKKLGARSLAELVRIADLLEIHSAGVTD